MIQEVMVFIDALHVERPLWLLLLALLPLLWLVAGKLFAVRRMRFPGIRKLRQEGLAMHPLLLALPGLLWWCGVVLLVIALARPIFSERLSPGEAKGIDIMLALDISKSMLQEDFDGKSRLDAAKTVALQFIENRRRDRIGLVLFKGKSFTQCPLTLDHDVLSMLVRAASVDAVPESGTATGSAILIAVNRLRASESPERVLILMTDGEHNAGEVDPVTAAGIAAGEGVRIYMATVSVPGSRSGEDMLAPARDLSGEVSRITGGRSFRANDANSLDRTFSEIDQLEKSRFTGQRTLQRTQLYPFMLAGALCCFLLELVLSNSIYMRIP